ncbi:hypothetical protein RKE38_12820 [Phycicoccus sp. M110.8]|uniref:hypothetical protein n=1 Tax=Phycicoccus sp. M110.8 TaxID=3075433 RepID=UPI0028FD59A7|nr:hypothetical protein [Phycicoccus sp. M110.8]MDU0314575.1 hypothetical protein [Phycicoccus sp. M110.8]HET8769107.1 hypothetical protein [Pedococcus sp.]
MSAVRRLQGWLFEPMPVARVAVLRLLVFAFVVVDVLLLHTSGWYHGWADPVWYEPLLVGQALHLPAATVLLVQVLKWGCVAAALAAMTGRAPRLLGWTVAVAWTWYQYVAFSYGKVDHDRADFVVALALLPTVGLAHLSDRRRSEAAGFALRAVQLAAVATYFLSAWAKVRFGGWEWVNSATMVRAVVRRGTPMAQWLLEVPWTLHWFQWVLFTAELTSPVIFLLSERWRRRVVAAWFVFHAMTYAAITIAFWPHLVMMLAFLPLERYAASLRARVGGRWRGRLPARLVGERS